MSLPLEGAVELLERALGYTRVALQGVEEAAGGNLGAPTPCSRWDLAQLLAHLEDALDAFTDAAGGLVGVHPVAARATRVDTIRAKAGSLLGAWLGPASYDVRVGDRDLRAPVLLAAAALEITVHGWDVARATGREHPVPRDLAVGLLVPARALITPADRVSRFAPPRERPGCAPDVRLLGHLGRDPGGHPESFPLRVDHRSPAAS